MFYPHRPVRRPAWFSRTRRRALKLPCSLLPFCCLLLLLGGCMSPFAGAEGQPSPTPRPTPTPTATPVPLNTDEEIAQALVQKMSLDQKLGQMVISEERRVGKECRF